MNWNGCGRKSSWADFLYYLNLCGRADGNNEKSVRKLVS
jgi:hypothetical protein